MKSSSKRWMKYLMIFAVLSSLILVGCRGPSTTDQAPTEIVQSTIPVEPSEPDVVRVGYLPIIAFQAYFVAIEKGYFADQGIEVEAQRFTSGSEMIAPLATGDLDVGGGQSAPSLFNAIQQDLTIKVVAESASMPAGFNGVPILARKDLYDSGELDEPAELAGKIYATNAPNSIGHYLVYQVLEREGLTLDDIEIVTMPFPEIITAFENGVIDAGIIPSPLYLRAVGIGAAEVLVPGDEIQPGVQNGIMYVGETMIGREDDLMVRFLVAYLTAVRELQGEGWREPDNLEILQTWTEIPLETLQNIPTTSTYYLDPNGSSNPEGILDFQSFYLEQGFLDYDEALGLDQIIDYSYLDEALDRLGVYTGP